MLRKAQLVAGVVVLHVLGSICVAKHHRRCSPSSCGNIPNISYPFRLQGDPPSCGFPEYELICENNRTLVNLQDRKYDVAGINYYNYTIQLVDPGLKKGSSCLISSPLHSLVSYYDDYGSPYQLIYRRIFCYDSAPESEPYISSYIIVLVKCGEAIRQDYYIPIIPCNNSLITPAGSSPSPSSSSSPAYYYAVVGSCVSVGDVPYSCTIGTSMAIQPSKNPRNLSMSDLQDYLLLGLRLSYMSHFCDLHCRTKGQYCRMIYADKLFECFTDGINARTSGKNCKKKMITCLGASHIRSLPNASISFPSCRALEVYMV